MSVPLIVRPKAKADIRDTYDELEAIRVGLGSRFLKYVNDTFERIESMPEMYGVVWRRVRAARIPKFRHVVYYVTDSNYTEVIAVVHGSRDSTAWRSRI